MLIRLLLVFISTLALAQPTSFNQAKRILPSIYKDNLVTFYCGCQYDLTKRDNMIDRDSCGYEPRNTLTRSGKPNERALRIEWEHVVPAENFGRQFPCWREGHPECVDSKGKPFKGRNCCSKVNPTFRAMEGDLMNLVPAIGELNADRSNFRFGMISDGVKQHGACDFYVDFKERKVQPRKEVRGDIARIYFYFEKTYGMKISDSQRKLFEAWDKEDPEDDWEREKRRRTTSSGT
jgi:deoxyribonuclease-1